MDPPETSGLSEHHGTLDQPYAGRLAVGDVELLVVSVPGEPRNYPDALTDSERNVARLLVRGWSYRAIAEARSVSENTVSAQVSSIMKKLGKESAHGVVAALASHRPGIV